MLVDHQFYRALGFTSVDGYVRNRLGFSPRKAWALLKIEGAAPCRRAAVGGTCTITTSASAHAAVEMRARTAPPSARRLTSTACTRVIRASGTAPRDVRWELGVRPTTKPFLTFVGDRLGAE